MFAVSARGDAFVGIAAPLCGGADQVYSPTRIMDSHGRINVAFTRVAGGDVFLRRPESQSRDPRFPKRVETSYDDRRTDVFAQFVFELRPFVTFGTHRRNSDHPSVHTGWFSCEPL
jgi:hypothetical protein